MQNKKFDGMEKFKNKSKKPFGGGSKSFGGGGKTFGGGGKTSGGTGNSYGDAGKSFGEGGKTFGGEAKSYGTGDKSRSTGAKPYGSGSKPYGGGSKPYGAGAKPYGSNSKSYGTGEKTYNSGERTEAGGEKTYGGSGKTYGGSGKTYGSSGKTYGSGTKTYGGSGKTYGSGSNTYGGGGKTYGSDTKTYGSSGKTYDSGKATGEDRPKYGTPTVGDDRGGRKTYGNKPVRADEGNRPGRTGRYDQGAVKFGGKPERPERPERSDRSYRDNSELKRDDMKLNREFKKPEWDDRRNDESDPDGNERIEGRNSVLEALKAGRSINKILVGKGEKEGSINQIIAIAREKKIIIQDVDRSKLDSISETHAHQGVIAFAAAKEYVEVDDILNIAKESGKPAFIIVLDEITDSYNLGSVLRSANASGAHGVIIPKRRAVGLTAAVSKASAGAIEHVPVARVTNLVQTLEYLKKQGVWVIGTDSDGEKPYYENDYKVPVAIVVGSEGEGIRRLVREVCDVTVNIPMRGNINSLNAAIAGAVVMFEVLKQRENKA